jgi:hypothetical protein
MAVACDVCGKIGHASAECTFYANIGPSVSEVSYAQSQGSYNPSWKNHPNLSYRHSQPSQTLVSSQGQNYKNNQFQNFGSNRSEVSHQSSTSGVEEMLKMQLEVMMTIKDSIKDLGSKFDCLL